MIVLDYTDRRPIYEQIVERFQSLVMCGVLEKDAPLPSVRGLAMELSINPNTIQRSYRELEQEGFVYTVKGRGCFVAGVPEANEEKKQELLKKLREISSELSYLGMTKEEIRKLL